MRCNSYSSDSEFQLWRGELPQHDLGVGVLPGVRTLATPRLTPERVYQRLFEINHANAEEHYGAFYSSELGGIVTDPAFMLLHMDDHMVHRGHGVFDTVLITDGYLYQLPEHLARLRASAQMAAIPLEASDAALARILLDTAAASLRINGIVKYWLTAGRGGFGLSPDECVRPGFYALASSELPSHDHLSGWKATTSPVAPREEFFARIKSNNYLPNVLVQMEAQSRGYDVGIFVDSEGYVLEGPNSNIAMVTHEDVLVLPPFDATLAGVTLQRLVELIPETNAPDDLTIRGVEQRPISVEEMMNAKEVFMTGSTTLVQGITSWDNTPIHKGKVGQNTLALRAMLENDMQPRADSSQHMAIPYGYLSGMREQLV